MARHCSVNKVANQDGVPMRFGRVTRWVRRAVQILLVTIVGASTFVGSYLALGSWLVRTYPHDTDDAWFTAVFGMLAATPGIAVALLGGTTRLLSWRCLVFPVAPCVAAWVRVGLL